MCAGSVCETYLNSLGTFANLDKIYELLTDASLAAKVLKTNSTVLAHIKGTPLPHISNGKVMFCKATGQPVQWVGIFRHSADSMWCIRTVWPLEPLVDWKVTVQLLHEDCNCFSQAISAWNAARLFLAELYSVVKSPVHHSRNCLSHALACRCIVHYPEHQGRYHSMAPSGLSLIYIKEGISK